ITGLTIGTVAIVITAITGIITTIIGNKPRQELDIQIELAREKSRASFFFKRRPDSSVKEEGRLLLLWLRRLCWLCCRSLGGLINLELFFQLLNQRGNFFLSLRFDLLPQRLFYLSAFLNVPRFKLSALLWAKS